MVTLCPSLLERGFCLKTSCQKLHDTSNFCSSCLVALTSAAEYNAHVRTPEHRQSEACAQWLHCLPCKQTYKQGSPEQTSHEASTGHTNKISGLPSAPPPVEIRLPPNTTTCESCRSVVPSNTYDQHCRTKLHISRQQVFNYLNAVARTQQNQNGVEVSGDEGGLDLGAWSREQPAAEPAVVWISHTLPTPVHLTAARTSASLGVRPGLQLCFTVTTISLPVSIELHSRVAVHVHFNPRGQRGRFEDRLELVFREASGNIFMITRPLKAVVANADVASLAPAAPYRPRRLARKRNAKVRVISGGEELWPDARRSRRRLPATTIPADLEQVLNHGAADQQIQAFRDSFMPDELTSTSYKQYWSSLVHAEHIQARTDLNNFDMDDVTLVRRGSLYELEVPGLAEKRPSVLKGDRINVHPHSEPDGVWFTGIVHDVRLLAVWISFHPSFPYRQSATYDIEFVLNPVPFRRMIQAVNTSDPRTDILFPSLADLPADPELQEVHEGQAIRPYNHLLNTNEEQLQAVRRVTNLPAGGPPFIIFGPPGTGKTMTIVECISQLLDKPSARILACAPSNSATDLIAQRLIEFRALGTTELFRLNAIWRQQADLPEELWEYSLYGRGFGIPAQEKLNSYRVIVTTCCSAARLYEHGIDPGHFTHIFIDEAGQASEPEVMIPVLPLAGGNANIILGGDPKQLGPVIRSPVARQLGMGTSYLERLMALPTYDEVTMRGISVTKLFKNFRSHEAILAFPNEQFYRNELVASATPNITDAFLSWNQLASPGFPVVFEAIAGEDMREATSPSFFNPHEASLVKEYVQGLLPHIASTKNIGIVTPYRAQVRKIRKLLEAINIRDIDVGSVENFQGQERQVIILSTVRSNQDFLSFDLKHTLGFVANKRRLNVAITRAQALLIIIGDPMVLGLDPLWRRFLYFIYHSGGWKGAPFPWDPDANPDDASTTASLAERDIVELLRRAGVDAGDDDPTAELDQAGTGDE
ncbi:hypothetical protein FS749_008829 [Ceratobasidium sp. UAMH 11750]|nr:hypothetical protein FS749_008829 [Ceratobasidium sp. UAMH 11750]